MNFLNFFRFGSRRRNPTEAEMETILSSPPSPPPALPVKSKKAKIKVAIDESIGAALAKRIEKRGYEIVVRAGHAETDESWMKRALNAEALFIISPDLDIPSMIEREGLPMVWIDFLFAGHINPTLKAEMPKDQKHAIWCQYLHDRIQYKLKFLNKEFSNIL